MATMDPIDRVFVSTPKSRSDGLRSALRLSKRRSAFGNSVGGIINTNVSAAGSADVEMAVVHDSLIKSSSPAPKSTLGCGFSSVFVGNSNPNQKQQQQRSQRDAIRVSSMPANPFRWSGSRDDDILIDNSHLSVPTPATREPSPGSQRRSEWADIFDLYEDQQQTPPPTNSYDYFYGQQRSPPHTPQSSPNFVPRQRSHSFRSISNPTTVSPNRRPVPKLAQKPTEYEPAMPLTESVPLPSSPAAAAQMNKQPSILKRLMDRNLMPWLANDKRRTPSGSSQKSQSNSGITTARREGSSPSSRTRKSDSNSKSAKGQQMELNAEYIIDQFRALSRRTIVLQPLDAVADFIPSLAIVVVIFEGLILMWLLYQLSVIVETLAMLIRAICLPLIIMGRIVGYM